MHLAPHVYVGKPHTLALHASFCKDTIDEEMGRNIT